MESKNVQKTRFYACLKTKSLYVVIEKLLKTHVETASLPLNKQNNNFMRDPWTFQIWTFINVQKWILQDYLFSRD
jgi:hypothetical protein